MKPSYRRADRVASEIREVLALVLSRFAPEPSLGRLTITNVTLSDDLKVARIFYSVFPGESPELYRLALLRYRGLIRKELSRQIRMKTIPLLEFQTTDRDVNTLLVDSSEKESEKGLPKKSRESSSLMDELEGK
ncbi:MAG: ribosome-binding factor A [Leptospirales bacterium]